MLKDSLQLKGGINCVYKNLYQMFYRTKEFMFFKKITTGVNF